MRSYEVNVMGTLRLLEGCRAQGVKRVVFAASSAAYGDTPTLPKVETMPPSPLSPYAAGKVAGEHLLAAYAHVHSMHTVALRYFNVFGPRQRHDSPYAAVVPIFAERLRAGLSPVVYGDGTQTRDFTFVANVVHANLLAGRAAGPLEARVLNIACGTSHALLELVERMQATLGTNVACEFRLARAGDVLHSRASVDAAREAIGYEVVVPFDEGLRATLAAQA
jgi:UDP-glucose 4-epimerase